MENEGIESLINLINRIEITDENSEQVERMEQLIEEKKYTEVIETLNELKNEGKIRLKNTVLKPIAHNKEDFNVEKVLEEFDEDQEETEEEIDEDEIDEKGNDEEGIYPKELSNIKLEERFIGLLLETPKAISMYYIVHEDCYFESDELLNIYKSILFTEGQAYAPQIAKNDFNFAI